jgi:hypothetical protein
MPSRSEITLTNGDLASKQAQKYFGMSTVEGLSYTPSPEERSRDAAQIVVTGRRSWKTLKGKAEAVWPPHLEAALIEGLLILTSSNVTINFFVTFQLWKVIN